MATGTNIFLLKAIIDPPRSPHQNTPLAHNQHHLIYVLPYKEPVAEENIKKARKLVALGMDARYIKDTLKIAGELDGVDGKNELIKMWLLEYDSKPKEKDPLLVLIENRKILAQKQKIIEALNASLAADNPKHSLIN
ncbi:hypothetical protein CTI12_AA285600 [Artemisia annua]|uniref:Uncharacterized protein n=1 Tax=Artemisia annua TaxID=35608 RepID=A0A2U1NBP5_ARTAN|nr:hypothetical protein CTI12_AA285600 [Artemisia annua]